MILLIRTDQPVAELTLYKNKEHIKTISWEAHRELAESLHTRINDLLVGQGVTYKDLKAIGVYQGPGSFTGLRIGVSVANALADSLQIPIASATGEQWLDTVVTSLAKEKLVKSVTPDYGAMPHITAQVK